MKDLLAVFKRTLKCLTGLMLFVALVPMASATITSNPSKFIVLDNQDPGFTITGAATWSFARTDTTTGPTWGYDTRYTTSVASETGRAIWSLGTFPSATGTYGFDVYIPADSLSINTAAVYTVQEDPTGNCSSFPTNLVTFSPFNQNSAVNEGQFRRIGTATLTYGRCYRIYLSNQSTDTGSKLYADAIRVEHLFESKATIPDMPFVSTNAAPGTTLIASNDNANPTIVTTLTVVCPANGNLDLQGSGESAAQTNVAGNNFNGLAYSISLNSTATDNGNVVQSSALATFNGDANRDFLNVRRVDSCTAGQSSTYRLTAYRAQAATGPASFIWNGRLVAHFFPN